jgi:hypothetical protein
MAGKQPYHHDTEPKGTTVLCLRWKHYTVVPLGSVSWWYGCFPAID